MTEDIAFKSINSGVNRFNTILRSHPGGSWNATAQKIEARQLQQRFDRLLESRTVNMKALGCFLELAAAFLAFLCIYQQKES